MGNKSSNTANGKSKKANKNAPKMTPNDFQLISVIGKGSYGKVFQVCYVGNAKQPGDNKLYAMKVLKKDQLLKRRQVLNTQAERRILEQMDHPFLVSLRYAFQTPEKLYMVMDFFAGGELFYHLKKLGRFAEDDVRIYAAEIVLALSALHENNIVYRDLKPENLLLDSDGHVSLTDFGLAKELGADGLLRSLCGTPEYLSPQVIQGQAYDKNVDYWALGTMLYEFLTGLPPFYSNQLKVMYERILTAKLSFNKDCGISPAGQQFIAGLLERDPSKRLGCGPNGLDDIKNHPWFKGMSWEDVYNHKVSPLYRPQSTQSGKPLNVDEQFRRAPVVDTPVEQGQLNNKIHFPDFTFAPEKEGGMNSNHATKAGDDWERL